MTKEELIAELARLVREQSDPNADPESDHMRADALLIEYIAIPEVTYEFNRLTRWYS